LTPDADAATAAAPSTVAVDAVAAAAVAVARAALTGLADDAAVGEHVAVEADAERVVTHLFDCLLPGYLGWRWAVTVVRAPRSRKVTVDDAVLLPGPEALLAPAWLPWQQRLRPGDLGVGDLLPAAPDDDRLEPSWNGQPADDDESVGFQERDDAADWAQLVGELDLTRRRVLSPLGLDDAFDRWWQGPAGPLSPLADAAPGCCQTCGFRIALRGRIGHAWGVCANTYSPSDGHVVALTHGCGAHSEATANLDGD